MDDSRNFLVLVMVLTAALVAPSAATAAAIVPPGNSAVNQYTQTIPTSKGNKEVRQKGDGSPSKTLGHSATKKLQKQGKDGNATAELAAAGTPASAVVASGSGSGSGGGSTAGGGSATGADGSAAQGSSGLGGSQAVADADEGKSGLGQVVGEVTGTSSSGDLGLLLPLAIIAACVWCAAYFWRHRRTAA
jgi:eukaryotic-like serine/threonine-protein kinase